MSRIGIIGGSGLYDLVGIKKIDSISLDTPFGRPSGEYSLCQLQGKEVVFLPRHGSCHQINPSRINYRANIYGMKQLEVSKIISVSACGSLKEEYKPLDFIIPDQFVDRTSKRDCTFFDEGVVVHVAFDKPVCKKLCEALLSASEAAGIKVHSGGTYVNIEGPQFSTLAESHLYRRWGMDIIGMTNMCEARLAREAEICYASLAAITDYDCWHQASGAVDAGMVLENLKKNIENSRKILEKCLAALDAEQDCLCRSALEYSIITPPKNIDSETKKKFSIFLNKYIK